MKTTENKTTIQLVEETTQMAAVLKEMNASLTGNKNKLKMIMNKLKVSVLGVGNFVLVITDRTRKDLDKEMVQKLLGDKYEECLKEVNYQTFEIKKA